MAQPNKIQDSNEPGKALSATEKADLRWNLSNRQPQQDEPSTAQENIAPVKPSARQRASERWGMSSNDEKKSLGQAEQDAQKDDGQSTGVLGKEKDFKYTSDKKNKKAKKGRLSGKQIGIGAGGIGVVGGGLFIGLILSGPFQLLQFSQLLQKWHFSSLNSFTNDRTSRLTSNFRRYNNTGTTQGTRLGRITGRVADRLDIRMQERSGLRIVYDNVTGRMSGFEIIDEQKARNIISNFQKDGINTDMPPSTRLNAGRFGDEVTGQIIDLSDTGAKTRASAIRNVINSLDLDNVSSSVGSRVLIKLGGVDFHPIKNRKRAIGQSLVDFFRAKLDQRRESTRNGATDPNARRLEAENTTDPDGNSVPNQDALDAVDGADGEVVDAIDAKKSGRLASFAEKFRLKLVGKIAGGAAAAIGAICVVRDIGGQAESLQYSNTILTMMRMGFEFIAVGEQIKTGQDVNLDEIGYYAGLLYDEESGLGYDAAASVQAMLGSRATGVDIDPAVKPDAVNGRPLLFRVIDQIPGIGTACRIETGIAGFISRIPVVGQITQTASAFAQGAIDAVLQQVAGITMNEFVNSIVAWLAGEAVDVAAEGPKLANYANYGARLASNLQSLAFGGRELSGAESAELRAEELRVIAEERSKMSVFERYLSLESSDSMLASMLRETPRTSSELANLFIHNPVSVFSNILAPKAKAQDAINYDFGFPEIGFSLAERNNATISDPIENAEFVEENFERLNDEFAECFPTKLRFEGDDVLLLTTSFNDEDAVTQFNQPDKCSDSRNVELLRFRAYLADTLTAKSNSCYEGDSASCDEIGFNAPIGSTSVDPNTSVAIVGDTSGVQCATGTTDMGTVIGYNTGNPYNIRLCGIPGFASSDASDQGFVRVNSTVSSSWLSLYQTAQQNGVNLSASSSFRTNEQQEYLWSCYLTNTCNNGNEAAQPGYSNHQMGFAVDIDIVPGASDPSLTACQANPQTYPRFELLSRIAPALGINAAVSSECWHWSATGT